MTDTSPLDLAAVLDQLRAATREMRTASAAGRLFYAPSIYARGPWTKAYQSIGTAIALIEAHMPKPRDEWMEEFKSLMADYARDLGYAFQGAPDLSTGAYPKLLAYVQAERDRLRGYDAKAHEAMHP